MNVDMTILTDAFLQVIVSSIWTNRARCALNRKSLIYSMRKVLMESSGRVNLNYHECLSTLTYDSNFFLSTSI